MTAEPDLLPSSVAAFTEALHGECGSLDAWLEVHDEREVRAHVEAYARANVAHATAARDAEIEALRAEVEDYRTNGAAAVRFAPSSAHWSKELRRLFGDDARTGIEVLENRHRQELARAERLAEALRIAEAALADIGDADREPGDDVAWCERRAALGLRVVRDTLRDAALNPTAAQENDDA